MISKNNFSIELLFAKLMLFSIFLPLFYSNCSDNDKNISKPKYSIEVCERETFIDVDYTFENEGLYKPWFIKQNSISDELFVLDNGNNCIYVFDKGGKFLNKIGRAGQGPGDLLNPVAMNFDKNGNIYIWEDYNNRFSVFSVDGKYLKTIKLKNLVTIRTFTISENDEIITRLYNTDFYLSIISKDGEIINQIGKIDTYKNKIFDEFRIPISDAYATVIYIRDTGNSYVVFLEHLPIIKVYSKSGILLKEYKLDHKELSMVNYINPEKLKEPALIALYLSVIYKDGHYYCLMARHDDNYNDKEYLLINVLDENFVLREKKYLPLKEPINIYKYRNLIKGFELLYKNIFLLPIIEQAEIYSYYSIKNNPN